MHMHLFELLGSRAPYTSDINIGDHRVNKLQPRPPPAPLSATVVLQKAATDRVHEERPRGPRSETALGSWAPPVK